ncbi:MAG: hypothetical protein WCG16_11970 [Methylococcales bacterium]
MKILKVLLVLGSLFAIAGAAVFQLLMLVANKLVNHKQGYTHQVL